MYIVPCTLYPGTYDVHRTIDESCLCEAHHTCTGMHVAVDPTPKLALALGKILFNGKCNKIYSTVPESKPKK